MSNHPFVQRESSRRKNQFNLHEFLIKSKIIAIEVGASVVFFVWLYRLCMRELGF